MNVEMLLMGLLGGGLLGSAGVGAFLLKRLNREVEKQKVQISTIETLYNEVQRASLQVDVNYLQMIEALVRALEARDTYTAGHSDRVNRYSMAIGKKLGLSKNEMDVLHHGSLLHDIGKIGVYDRILLKPQALNDEEFKVMQEHPEFGAEILKNMKAMKQLIPIILHHHEKQDGTGYPLGLKGDEIPLGARIVQVADTWDAMASDRPYRRRLTKPEAIERMRSAAGTQLDVHCVEAFLSWLSPGPKPIQA